MERKDTIDRKSFNIYVDMQLVKLVDLWAYREGTSRSGIIERMMESAFTTEEAYERVNPGAKSGATVGGVKCQHVDLSAHWLGISNNRNVDVMGAPPVPVSPILGQEHVPE